MNNYIKYYVNIINKNDQTDPYIWEIISMKSLLDIINIYDFII